MEDEADFLAPEVGQQSWGEEVSGTGQGIEDMCIGVLRGELSQAGKSLGSLEHLRPEEFGKTRIWS